ncbi:MAG: hypothetical protein JRF40_15535, partial [Deltaproteobacteria bacterium]|nr:hypothetical protein [Deltaproteobacteria bacterium]
IADLAKKINRDGHSNVAYILQQAAEKWKKDPFVQSLGNFDVADKEESYQSGLSGPASILFSGFIHAGDKMLAIINGLEYEEGDVMGNGGYSVKKITREKVILESGSGEDLVVLIEKY